MITKEQQKKKYENDKRYGASADDFDNMYSIRNYKGLYFETRRLETIFKLLNKHKITFKNKKILDIGCNYGLYSQLFAYLKRTTTGIYGLDYIQKYIDTAKNINNGINYIQHDLYNKLPFEDNFFDLMLINYVFNAIPKGDLHNIIENIDEKIKKGGYLIIFDFRKKEFLGRMFSFIKGVPYKDYYGKHILNAVNDKVIKKEFKNYEIVDKKSLMPLFVFQMLGMKLPYFLIDLIGLFSPKSYIVYILRKKNDK